MHSIRPFISPLPDCLHWLRPFPVSFRLGARRWSTQSKRCALNDMNDLRVALRQLRKSPSSTILPGVTLALGIGMNTAIFSLIQDLFLRGLPFKEPDRVVRIYGASKERDLK